MIWYTLYTMKHLMKVKRLHITTLQDQYLKKVSELTGYSVAEIIRRAIDEYVERRFPDVSEYTDKSDK